MKKLHNLLMPRRNYKESRRKAFQQLSTQWRYLLRNPDFRKDLQCVRRGVPASIEWGTETTMTEAECEEVTQASRREEAARLRAARAQRKKKVVPVKSDIDLLKKWRLTWLPGRLF